MHTRTLCIQRLINSDLVLVGLLVILAVFAAPQLVTPQLNPGIQGQSYAVSLFIGSALPRSSAGATALPAVLTATQNGIGTQAISDTLNTSVSFTNIQIARNATAVSAGAAIISYPRNSSYGGARQLAYRYLAPRPR